MSRTIESLREGMLRTMASVNAGMLFTGGNKVVEPEVERIQAILDDTQSARKRWNQRKYEKKQTRPYNGRVARLLRRCKTPYLYVFGSELVGFESLVEAIAYRDRLDCGGIYTLQVDCDKDPLGKVYPTPYFCRFGKTTQLRLVFPLPVLKTIKEQSRPDRYAKIPKKRNRIQYSVDNEIDVTRRSTLRADNPPNFESWLDKLMGWNRGRDPKPDKPEYMTHKPYPAGKPVSTTIQEPPVRKPIRLFGPSGKPMDTVLRQVYWANRVSGHTQRM